jgi:LytS/YehU family sensor histidine kinase
MEKERVGKRCDILFVHPIEKDTLAGYEIAPLLLITLVENAFKHSVTIVNRWYVYIKITVDDDVLYFYIYNSLGDESLKTESTSIGLVNVRQRLELLYKGLYNFETSSYGKEYRTYLSVRLNG